MNKTITTKLNCPKSEVSDRFLQGMADRMGMSFYKYGSVAEAYPAKVDALASLKARLERYAVDGNTEWLLDVANFAMIEFMYPRHPNAHYEPTDASPGRVWLSGTTSEEANTHRAENNRVPLYTKDGD